MLLLVNNNTASNCQCTSCMTAAAGSLSLETIPLKSALKSEAASWKTQFAQNLHSQSAEDLKTFDAYIRRVECVKHWAGLCGGW